MHSLEFTPSVIDDITPVNFPVSARENENEINWPKSQNPLISKGIFLKIKSEK